MGQTLAKRIRDKRKSDRDAEKPQVIDNRLPSLIKNIQVATIEIDNPEAEDGGKIVAFRQLRGDPLARLHAHRHISDAEYHAGRAYQGDWECAEQGPQGIDPTREYVDGGRLSDPYSIKRMEARDRLKKVCDDMGADSKRLIQLVLIEGYTIERAALERFRRHGQTWLRFYGAMLRDALKILAVEYGLAMRE